MSSNDRMDADVVDTRVGSAVLVKGDIEGDGNVVVEGRVEGRILIKGDLHVAQQGEVKSSVNARNIFVEGILVGPVTAGEKVELATGGRLVGDVKTPRFLINEGALYKGKVDMVGFEPGEVGEPRSGRTAQPQRRQPARGRGGGSEHPEETPPVPIRRQVRQESAANTYAPPPAMSSPEFIGVKKAIIIKKKTEESA